MSKRKTKSVAYTLRERTLESISEMENRSDVRGRITTQEQMVEAVKITLEKQLLADKEGQPNYEKISAMVAEMMANNFDAFFDMYRTLFSDFLAQR